MSNNLLIAGAGQLGSRYLQGLALFDKPLNIWVYDISEASLEQARHRWEDCSCSLHDIKYVSSLSMLPVKLDVVCVTSNSDVRLALIQEIVKHTEVRFWILEKLLVQRFADLSEVAKATSDAEGVWVNTPMYLWPLYSNLRKNFPKNLPVQASFMGISGLACNAIHYIDYISRWNSAAVTEVDTSGLNPVWVPSKRAGFYEAEGQLAIRFTDGSSLIIAGNTELKAYDVNVEVIVDGEVWLVDEEKGRAVKGENTIKGNILHQSELFAPLLREIFQNGVCNLPTLDMSIAQHAPLIRSLLAHWNFNMPEKLEYLPIT